MQNIYECVDERGNFFLVNGDHITRVDRPFKNTLVIHTLDGGGFNCQQIRSQAMHITSAVRDLPFGDYDDRSEPDKAS